MTYWVRGCAQRCDLWPRWKANKKGQKLSCVKLAICPDHPRRHRPLKFCVRGRVREVVIYFKFHENRSRGLGAVGIENRPLPLTRPMAYTTACTTVQAVMMPALPLASTRLSKLWILCLNDILHGNLCKKYLLFSYFLFFLVSKHAFIRCVDFTRIAVLNAGSGDVTN